MMNRDLEVVAQHLLVCASTHEPESRLLGNIRADELALLALDYLLLRKEAEAKTGRRVK
jgi:hypothetical protein